MKAMELFKAKQQLEEQLQMLLKEKETLVRENRTFAVCLNISLLLQCRLKSNFSEYYSL
jgi:hypothetical protein